MSITPSESLNEFRLRNIGCNVIIKIGPHEFPAHRVVLMARIEYFRNILTEKTNKTKKFIFEFEPRIIDSTYFSDFLNYVYISRIDFTNENIWAIYKTAEYFRFNELLNEVKEHPKSNTEMKNIPYFQTISNSSGSKSFGKIFKKSIFQNSLASFWQRSVKRSSKKKPISILSFKYSNSLEKVEENDILEMMFHYSVDWILADEVNRSGMLLELFKNIPLESLSFDFLKAVSHYEQIRKDSECLKLLFDAFLPALKSNVRKERRRRIDNLYAKYILYAIGGSDGDELSSVSEYNSATREWTATTPMPGKRSHFGCTVIEHRIYVCGGQDGYRDMNELTVFDTYTRTWTQLTPMKHARQLCSAATLNEQIYVAGGTNEDDDDHYLAVVERYNVHTNSWQDVAPMTTKREGLELVALNGFLYAIGGHDGTDRLNSVERYDPKTDKWITMNNTNNKYYAFGSAVWNNNIYIAGRDKCEMYFLADDKWTEMPAPSQCDHGRLAVYDEQLYAIGGVVGAMNQWNESKSSKTVEVFDMKARVWRPESDMNIARWLHGVAVVKKSFFSPIKLAFDANESLNELQLQTTCCDVFLEIGGHEFPAHRKVLIARLEHFGNILTLHTEQKNKSVISLDRKIIDSIFFSEILNYIYTSKMTSTNENIRPIYKTAEYFRFDEHIYELEEHMEFTVNIDNVYPNLSIAIELCLKSLQRVLAQFVIQQTFSDINQRSRQKLIPTLSIEHLRELLQRLKKNGSIEDMFHFTVDWIAYDEVNRSRRLLKLLKNIPLQKLGSDFLIEIVAQNDLVRNNIECLNWLLDAVISTSNSHNESREDILYAIGGMDGDALSLVSQYNSTTREWTATTPMPSKRSHFGCAVIGHKIYVCGGNNEQRVMNSLTVFDTLTRAWTQLTPMKHARENCGVAVLNGQIYVAGGWNGTDQLTVVERYNVHTNQWKDVAPMTAKRSGLELVALNGFLYAIGGHDGDEALNSVDRYNPQTDQWTPMNNTNNKYNAFGSAILNDNIYIAGHNKCEVYNTAFKRWIEIPSPGECNLGRRLAVFNEKLYAIGGRVGGLKEWKGIKTVEVYDFEERAWKPEPDMDVARCFHGVAVVKN